MTRRIYSGRRSLAVVAITFTLMLFGTHAFAATVTLNPSHDNSIYQGIDPGTGENFELNSCGAGTGLFTGMTNDSFRRRSLMRFNIAESIPAGSTINSVTLSMDVNRSGDNQDAAASLHPLTTDWGEGPVNCDTVRGGGTGLPANPGDATWLDARSGQISWVAPGGDYGAASASSLITTRGTAIWTDTTSGDGLVRDVQNWLDNPLSNLGWIIVGEEGRSSTTRRFASREGSPLPNLMIDFTPTGEVYACCFDDGICSVSDSTFCTDQGGTPNTSTNSCEPNPCPQPVGACCNLDESCSDTVDRLICEIAGGEFQGTGTSCSQGSIDCGLTPFVDLLPIPPVLQPTGTRADGVSQYTVEVVAATQQLHSDLPNTDLWTYNGAYPSFTIEAMQGQPIEVTYVNNLPTAKGKRGNHILEVDECPHGPNYYADSARISTHLHGGHLPARFDGQPEYTILPGEFDIYQYVNNQYAATLWYHDHALGITRLNVYSGMAGFYLLRDTQDTGDATNDFGLPSGDYEIAMVVQDREFNPDGSLFYNPTIQDAFKGDKILVNGKVWPFLNVAQGKYRFRLLNGSQAREYSLRLENLADPTQVIPFTLIGTDLGLIAAPVPLDTIAFIAPGERMDVIIDFAVFPAGTEIVLKNDETTIPRITNVMKFVVTNQPGFTGPLPTTLRPVTPLEPTGVPMRYFRLVKKDKPCSNDDDRIIGEWLIESLDAPGGNVIGQQWDDITEFPTLGSREIWEFENPTNSMHPMHVHLVKFQVLDKVDINTGQLIPLEPWENGTWKDTVRAPPHSRVRVIMDFEDYPGRFPYHCHILDHEDHEMMRQFQATNDPANCNDNGACEVGEDSESCPDDCAKVSGALRGNGLCEAGDGENCITAPEDCAGKQNGAASKQFCCGAPGGTNNIGCGNDADDDHCIDASAYLFCRVAARAPAACGDRLCEGAETVDNCAVDCAEQDPGEVPGITCDDALDNDKDGLVDGDDPDCPLTICDAPDGNDLTLSKDTVSDTRSYHVCNTLTVGPDYVVSGPIGDLTLRAGNMVIFLNGFRVGVGGVLRVTTP